MSFLSEPKFFGRRKGRVVRKAKSFLLENMLPQLRIFEAKDFNKEQMFAEPKKEICLEIGFGDGQHIYGQAKNNPDVGYVGVEVFQNGVANLLSLISKIREGDNLPEQIDALGYDVNNIRIYDDDVRKLFDKIPDEFFDKVYLLFPDPWPKKKHASRRFVNPENLKHLARILKKGGFLRKVRILIGKPFEFSDYYDKKLSNEDIAQMDKILVEKMEEVQTELKKMLADKKKKKCK